MSWIDVSDDRDAERSGGPRPRAQSGHDDGPGTNTYLVGRRDPILIDTGAGVAEYPPLLSRYMTERGWSQPSRVILTHRHPDHEP